MGRQISISASESTALNSNSWSTCSSNVRPKPIQVRTQPRPDLNSCIRSTPCRTWTL